MSNTLLEAKELCGGYTGKPVIAGVSCAIEKGDFIGIIGPNGSGKTTLLKLLTRVLNPYSGSILLEGTQISAIPLKEFCRRVAFVPQDTMINFPFTAQDIVLLGRIPHLRRLQQESARDFTACRLAMELTDTLGLKNKRVDELSSGERQRIVIAKALAQEPALLLLDEPTSHLDIGHQIQILDMLKDLNRQQHLTIAMVLHDLNLASEYCNKIILLDKGSLYRQGTPQEVLTYDTIESVYHTVVVVSDNPINSKPFVILVSKEAKKCAAKST